MAVYEIEVFRTGTHTSSNGQQLHFSSEAVDEAIAAYNPRQFRVPLIVSHSTGEYSDKDIVRSELAFGVVDRFKRIGDRVIACFSKISSDFKQWVDEGRLHSISSSFYLPTSPHNPNPGKLSFRHVAALGTNPPAVKGLRPLELQECVAFSDGHDDQTIAFMMPYASPIGNVAMLMRNLRDWLIESKDLETAEALMPSEAIADLEAQANRPLVDQQDMSDINSRIDMLAQAIGALMSDRAMPDADYAEDVMLTPDEMALMTPAEKTAWAKMSAADKKAMAKKVKARAMSSDMNMEEEEASFRQEREEMQLQKENENLRTEVAQLRLGKRKAEVASFVEKHKTRLTPGLRSFTADFAEGAEEVNLVDFMAALPDRQLTFMQEFITRLPQQVEFNEVIRSEEETGDPVDFVEIGALAKQKIRESRSKGIELSEAQAVDAIMAERGLRF